MSAEESKSYGSWKLTDLRNELRKRKAKQTGKKADLITRLEFYDRNFGRSTDERQVDDGRYTVVTPERSSYKDINSDTKLPTLTEDSANTYLMGYGVSLSSKIRSLYTERFLFYVRATEKQNKYFILSSCGAEMKKHVRYEVDVVLSSNGVVLETQCECAAGSGPEAHCKHVQCTLLAIVSFGSGNEILTTETCTQQLQTFHHCKRFKGSPIKAENLQLRKPGQGKDLQKLRDFDPRPKEFIRLPSYQSSVQNLCVNFQATHCSDNSLPMPILQTIPPANLYALAADHDYLQYSPEDTFLNYIEVQEISSLKCQEIEQQTIGQSSNKLWHEERSKRITSSNFGKICKRTDRTNNRQLAASLINPRPFSCESIRHGQKYESVAVQGYEQLCNVKTKPCGLFVSVATPYLASSPDRLVEDDVIVEVKCPYVSREKEINSHTVPYLKTHNNVLSLETKHDYFYQIQGQLYCTGRQECHLVVYTLKDMKVVVIKRDDHFIDSMVKQLSEFYHSQFRPVLLEYKLYRRMGTTF